MRAISGIVGGLLLMGAVGCGEDDDLVITPRGCSAVMLDAAGGEYPTNDANGCFPTIGADSPVGWNPDGGCGESDYSPGMIFGWGRLFEACSACGSASSHDLCRPLICETDEDCPLFDNVRSVAGERQVFVEEFECRNGLCQSADLESHPPDDLYHHEAGMLCSAPLERREIYEGPDACPGVEPTSEDGCPLPLPVGCLQP
jgi:hypothetical protein